MSPIVQTQIDEEVLQRVRHVGYAVQGFGLARALLVGWSLVGWHVG